MVKFRTVKTSFIIIILLFSMSSAFTFSASADKLLTYDAVLKISYDESVVNNAIFSPDGQPVSIPLTISYKVEVPPNSLGKTFFRILLFQTIIITTAKITLSVENEPAWAAVSIIDPNPVVDIDENFQETKTAVAIAAHHDAPAEGFSLKIKAESRPALNGHVPGATAETNIVFQPGYTPLIDPATEEPSLVIDPQETINFPIKIRNLGNKQTRVTAKIINRETLENKEWVVGFSQSQVIIPSPEEGDNVVEMYLTVTPPYNFGWHNDYEPIDIEFTPSFSPAVTGGVNLTGDPVPFQVQVRSRGFSTPGFEFVAIIGALAIIVLIKKRRLS